MKAKKEYAKEIGARIKSLRLERGMTMEELAQKVGYESKSAIYNIENARQMCSVPVLVRIAEALGVSTYYLQFGEEPSLDILIENFRSESVSNLEYDLLLSFRKLSDDEKKMLVNIIRKSDERND